MSTWKTQLERMKLPYPQKAALQREIAVHLEHCPEEDAEAFSEENLAELYWIHNTVILRLFETFPRKLRLTFEYFLAGAPLVASLIYLHREDYMLEFIRQGGVGMYVVLIIGAGLGSREILLLFRVLVVKDHSEENLRVDTMTVLVGVAALVLLGVSATVLGGYSSVAGFLSAKELPVTILIAGLAEASTCLVVSTVVAAMVLLLHFFTRRVLGVWRVPVRLLN